MHDQRENRFISNMIPENATQSSIMTEGKCKNHSKKLLQVWVTPGNDRKRKCEESGFVHIPPLLKSEGVCQASKLCNN